MGPLTNEKIREFYLEWEKEKLNLELTRVIVHIWGAVLERSNFVDKLEELEELIIVIAKREWGPETVIKFYRELFYVQVVNLAKNKSKMLYGKT